MKVNLLLHFEEELKAKIQLIANKEQRSLNSLITKVLSDYCEYYNHIENKKSLHFCDNCYKELLKKELKQ